jgi:hypothetical protein
MMLFLVWIIILSVVQDYVWVLLGVPDITHTGVPAEEKSTESKSEEKKSEESKENDEEEAQPAEDEATAIETEVVAEEDGDDI